MHFLVPLVGLFKLFLFFFYFTYLTAGDERTIGKMLFGIKVVKRADGEPLSMCRAFAPDSRVYRIGRPVHDGLLDGAFHRRAGRARPHRRHDGG